MRRARWSSALVLAAAIGASTATCTCTIVEAHGGRLGAENRAEGGAIFTFAIPRWPARGGLR